MSDLELTKVSKVYPGGVEAVHELDLTVDSGTLLVLLGPSGCGKTTVLRMIAGLEDITSGTVTLNGRVLNEVAERDRDIAMVFQNYALYPHMTVYRNLEYPLRHRKVLRRQRDTLVREVAETLALSDFLDKKPAQLSGGQRQRVAMGRAMVRQPRMFLMDEPLSNLDAALRSQMRTEIHALQRRLGVTTMFVTHDQVEAMTLGDRVAIMRDGTLQQFGTPDEVYRYPANVFVAAFLGSPGMTLFQGRLNDGDGRLTVSIGNARLEVDEREAALQPRIREFAGRTILAGVRPESVVLRQGHSLSRCVNGRVEFHEALGSSVIGYFTVEGLSAATIDQDQKGRIELDVDSGDPTTPLDVRALLTGRFAPDTPLRPGENAPLALQPGALRFFDVETGAAL